MSERQTYVLTITCPDTVGIVAAVSGFLTQHDCFITESAQYGDPVSRRFFMRIVFAGGALTPAAAEFRKLFAAIADRFQMIWQLHDLTRKPRVVIMVSKFGHCLVDLLHRYHTGQLNIEIPAVISNHPDMRSIVEWHGIPYHYLAVDKHDKEAQEGRVMEVIDRSGAELVVLARYMQILSTDLCRTLQGRAINIHHSFLPSFKGAKPYHQAYEKGVKLVGATAHYINNDLDEGPIITQGVEAVDHAHYPEDLVAKGRDIECLTLAKAIGYHLDRRVFLNENRTVIL